MSVQSIPEPIPLATGSFNPAQPAPSARPRCRAITVDGRRCKKGALGGLHLCFAHYRNRRPALPAPRKVSVPLLEDRSAIQLMITQVLHGILSNRIDPVRARVALYALRIATLSLPRSAADSAPADESVCRLGRDHEDFISADSDPSDSPAPSNPSDPSDASSPSNPPLNPSCSLPETLEDTLQLLDSLETENHCHPELDAADLPNPDPTHDYERCHCFTCTDFREAIEERMEEARLFEEAQKTRSARRAG